MSETKLQQSTLGGVFAPVLTPVHDDLAPDFERFVEHSKYLLDNGCHGLCPFGTTSEANSFSMAERMALLEALVDSGVPANVLMPGTGCCSIPETVTLTEHAVKLGCAGVLMLPPFFYKGVSDNGIFRSIAEVIERVGDDRLKVYLYHIPPVAQVGYSLTVIEHLIDAYPHIVVGAKDSSGDWNNQLAMLQRFPGFAVFSGSEKFLLSNLRNGGAGSINAVANVIVDRLRRVYDNWETAEADDLQTQVMVVTDSRGVYAPVPVLKQIAAKQKNDHSWLNLRPPLEKLSEEEIATLMASLGTNGLQL